MVSKADEDLVDCVSLNIKYGLNILSDSEAEALANLFNDIIIHHTHVGCVDINLESFDYIRAKKQ